MLAVPCPQPFRLHFRLVPSSLGVFFMENFADQCLDLARSLLGQNLDSINEDGTIQPIEGEEPRIDESGHAALAIGEYFRATNQTSIDKFDLVDLVARCVTAQAFSDEENANGLAYAALGLLSFGPSKERNAVWERLVDVTQERLDEILVERDDAEGHLQAFNIAKAVTRYSFGLTTKDETGKLIDAFCDGIRNHSSAGFVDDRPKVGIGGSFDIYGILSFVFIRQALQLHGNIHLRERKLPSLRTFGEKYIKMMPDVVRQDGMGWIYGRGIGAYGQMHCISIILQGIRDGWIPAEKKPQYYDILRRLFQFFFMTYIDQEHGYLVIRDPERTTMDAHTTRMANFDAARYLCQWSRLARSIGGQMNSKASPVKTAGRWVIFNKTQKREQGLFIYQDSQSGLHVQLPLVNNGGDLASDSLAFPHSPGIFDWPAATYLPVMLPELTFGEHVTVPAFYGLRCRTGLGLRKAFYFRYEQPELITREGKVINNLASVQVNWNFLGNKVTSEFVYTARNQVQMDKMRYCLVIATPHSAYRVGTTFTLGAEGLRANVLRDDFQGAWQDTEVVTNDPAWKTYHGNVHYIQTLMRDHPLQLRPAQQYRLIVEFEPDIALADE